jgi:hypothetical protein
MPITDPALLINAASPPLLPPTILERLYGFLLTPYNGFRDSIQIQHSLVFVRPINMQPAFLMFATISASEGARKSLRAIVPVAFGIPSEPTRSHQSGSIK